MNKLNSILRIFRIISGIGLTLGGLIVLIAFINGSTPNMGMAGFGNAFLGIFGLMLSAISILAFTLFTIFSKLK